MMKRATALMLCLSTCLTFSAQAAPAGIDTAAMDRSAVPGDDFYRFANGTWLATTEIPADRSAYGTGAALIEKTLGETKSLIEAVSAAGGPPSGDLKLLVDYYASFMDEAAIETRGLEPLKPELARIAALKTPRDVTRELGAGIRADVDVLNSTNFHTTNILGLWIAQDLDAPGRYLPFLLQGGLILPDRDYYLIDSPKMAETRQAYQAHIERLLALAGIDQAKAKAGRIMALETAIARAHASRVESIDVSKGDNHWKRQDFKTRAPGLDWDLFLTAAGLGQAPELIVWHPGALSGIATLVGQTPIESWKDYLTFHAIERAAPFLPRAFVDENFTLYGSILSGTPKLRDRWKRGVDATNGALGDVVGRLYAARYFPPEAKAQLQTMVKALIAAFQTRVEGLDWMAETTKTEAKAKLAALKVGIGYPDKWQTYQGLDIRRGDALGNAARAGKFETKRRLAWLNQPVDRDEWVMTPQTVNAVNLPSLNALNFPAAILQPPYFDPNRAAAANFGAIGAIIGHEISHSFDDQGAKFDSKGRLRDWWTTQDYGHFTAAGDALARQFDSYRPFPDLAVNGRQTLSENIADLAGLGASLDACHKTCQPADGQDLTMDQIFFVSFDQSWRSKMRDPALRQRILTDGHAPPQYRALTVRNLDAWYAAFDVKTGQALYLEPDKRVRVW